MSCKEEFRAQWKGFSTAVESAIIRQIKQEGAFSLKEINYVVRLEMDKWENPSQYQGIWLNKMRKNEPETAKKIEEELKKVKLEPKAPPKKISMLPYTLAALLMAAAGCGIMALLHFNVGIIAAVTAVIFLIAEVILHSSWKKKAQRQLTAYGLSYIKQLNRFGDALIKICDKADQQQERKELKEKN